MTKHEAMIEYIKPIIGELTGGLTVFNFANNSPGSLSFLTDYSGKTIKKYIRAADKEYGFSVVFTWYYSPDTDSTNIEAMNMAQRMIDWIDEQNRSENYPDFGTNCKMRKIESLQNMPNLATVDLENNLAQYMVQCRVIYFEKEK
ncbi:hypothetical protein NE683_12340 [Bariatricus massiliensis]|uniref:Uncharacterized protein n=1 Tax=Bariatricus massiliensis TaxID=1745713 RepID=A0ABS8DH26_9FIRM|nr:hypothetical protein [Bariatricus massiliensis]MCB7306185.1 hypothetical protein [Bariatricus massiliensis]MCB7375263.1 hypothetical protein [Bariatricus massiliensis]MCB7387723.1 hypothetical protein [Bariatricus massiliensis]MCB7411884.1 hypothetical protein [Bariatricus massiliensis]MCQ5254020.1 hypothetical protein [Bariatricus massiliensis]